MTASTLFGMGLLCTLAISVTVVVYLRRPLRKQLTELCGNPDRAEFWTSFSVVTVGLVPLIFALWYEPTPGFPALLAVAQPVKWGLVGIVVSVLILGWVVSRFIPRNSSKANL